jgi:hypothetical protein
MQKSGFFNALLTNGEYDRKYNANDYCENLAVIINNGVLRSPNDDLKVTADGMVVTVGVGRAWIDGHYYFNDTSYSFAAVTAPAGGTRYDRVFLRLNKNLSARSISLVYEQGIAGNSPTKPAPVRDNNVYDLVLADIYVGTNATSLSVKDTRSDAQLCGWVYSTSGDNSFFKSLDRAFNDWFESTKNTLSSVTLFKRYNWRALIEAETNTVSFDIPQYDETTFIEVYTNGVLDTEGVDYTLENSVITFSGLPLTAGTEVEVKCYKSIDGTGILSVADEITALQNAVAKLNAADECVYKCNGANDNVKLSELAQEWLSDDLDYSSKTIKIFGTFGATAACAGAGTAANPYKWFNFGLAESVKRRITFDFSTCTQISLPITAGTSNVVFAGYDVHVIGANVIATQTSTNTTIKMFDSNSGSVSAEDCRFWITAYSGSFISQTGNFTNCRASVANASGDSYCFQPATASLLKINGGEYYGYTGGSAHKSAVIGQTTGNAVSVLNGVNAPTVARSGYYQTHAIFQDTNGGRLNCSDLISELAVSVASNISDVRGTIAKSKPGTI